MEVYVLTTCVRIYLMESSKETDSDSVSGWFVVAFPAELF